MTEFENPETITGITAHYLTPTGRESTKEFTSVAEYHRWEKRVEPQGYDIHCVDTTRNTKPSRPAYEELVAALGEARDHIDHLNSGESYNISMSEFTDELGTLIERAQS